MRARPTPPFVDASNVVDLGHYRRQKRLRSSLSFQAKKQQIFQPPESRQVDFWLDANYRARMKVNAIVFVFLTFLIISGIWLLDELTDAFGPERLTHQHSQIGDGGVTAMVRSASGEPGLFEVVLQGI
jgi:hypothetical protein